MAMEGYEQKKKLTGTGVVIKKLTTLVGLRSVMSRPATKAGINTHWKSTS